MALWYDYEYKGWYEGMNMPKPDPEKLLEEIRQSKIAANRSKNAVVVIEKTSKRRIHSIDKLLSAGKIRLTEGISEFNKRLSNEVTRTRKVMTDDSANIKEIRKTAKQDYDNFKKTYKAATGSRNGIATKHKNILKLSDEAANQVNEINKNSTRSTNSTKKINELLDSSRKKDKEIASIYDEAEAVNTEIQNTYAITLDTTMAGTFKERRDSLRERSELWEKLYLGSVGVIVLSVILVIILGRNDNFVDLVTERLVLVTPFVLLSFILSKQFSHERKLYEEYAFKTAAAQSLRGYTLLLNKEFENLENARNKILDFTIKAMEGIYDRDVLLQNPSVFHLIFGNDLAKFEARIEDTVYKAVKKEAEETKESLIKPKEN